MSYQRFTLEERSMIAPMRILGLSVLHIAAQLGRAPSIISRDLRRNGDGTGAYAGYWAHHDARRRRQLAVRHSCLTSGTLAAYVRAKLQVRWSQSRLRTGCALTIPPRPPDAHQSSNHLYVVGARYHGGLLVAVLAAPSTATEAVWVWAACPAHDGTGASRRPTSDRPTSRARRRLGGGSRGWSRPARVRGHPCRPSQSQSPRGEGVAPDCCGCHGHHAADPATAPAPGTAYAHR